MIPKWKPICMYALVKLWHPLTTSLRTYSAFNQRYGERRYNKSKMSTHTFKLSFPKLVQFEFGKSHSFLLVCFLFCHQRMDDVQRGKQMDSNGQFLVSEPLATLYIKINPVLWFCPPPGAGWQLLSGANGECETQALTQHPQESQAVVRWGQLPLSSCLLVCSENTPCRGHSSQKPLCDLRKSPWKQWNESLHWNLESIPVSHRKKIRCRTTEPVVQRNLGRLWLTGKSWKTSPL